jgi:hypothetical protein
VSDTNISLGRNAVREMVEDMFRSQLLYHQNLVEAHPYLTSQQRQEATIKYVERLFDRTDATAALMPPEQAEIFKQMV